MIATLTVAPSQARATGPVSLSARRRARYAAQADSHPTPTASDPTSVIGTRIASPNIAAAPVSVAISAIAGTGVPNNGWMRPSAG